MSYVSVTTAALATAASDLACIGSTLSSANAVAAAPTTAVLAAGADEVSLALAAIFSGHGQAYQRATRALTLFHDTFVETLHVSSCVYTGTESGNAATMQTGADVAPGSVATIASGAAGAGEHGAATLGRHAVPGIGKLGPA